MSEGHGIIISDAQKSAAGGREYAGLGSKKGVSIVMPAFYTHYIFGRLGYHDMEEGALKEMVRRHKKVYAFGLSGPDIFFYFAPDQLLVHPTPGSRLHEEKCGAFLRCMLKEVLSLSGKEREIGIAYLAGFIAHYALDVSCHPHVYAYIEEEASLLEKGLAGRVGNGELGRSGKEALRRLERIIPEEQAATRDTEKNACGMDGEMKDSGKALPDGCKKYGQSVAKPGRLCVRGRKKSRAHQVSAHEKTGIHFRYECAMDHYFLEHYAMKEVGQLHQGKMVQLDAKERRVIARLVATAYNKIYDKPNMSETSMRAVLFCVRVVQRMIRDPYGKKEQLLAPVERFVYRHPFLAGLFVNDNCYGVGWDEWEKMDELFRAGRKEYEGMMEALAEVVESALSLAKGQKSQENAALLEARLRYERALRLFAQRVGSRSYHTGMPV